MPFEGAADKARGSLHVRKWARTRPRGRIRQAATFEARPPLMRRVAHHWVVDPLIRLRGFRMRVNYYSRKKLMVGLFSGLRARLYESALPAHLAARKVAALKDTGGSGGTRAKNIALKLHLNWGRFLGTHVETEFGQC